MVAGLRGDHRLLDAGQQPLGLRQRQPQVRDVAEVTGPAELHQLDTARPAVSPRFHQLQRQTHPRPPSWLRPNWSYRSRTHSPNLWTLRLFFPEQPPGTAERMAVEETQAILAGLEGAARNPSLAQVEQVAPYLFLAELIRRAAVMRSQPVHRLGVDSLRPESQPGQGHVLDLRMRS